MPRRNYSQHKIAFWFITVWLVTSSMFVLVIHRMSLINDYMQTIVSENNRKSAAVVEMRESIRKRQIIVRSIFLQNDPFERDQLRIDFYPIAQEFVNARDRLLSLPLNQDEKAILEIILRQAKYAYPLQNELIEVAMEDTSPADLESRLDKVLTAQSQVIVQLNRLIAYQQALTEQAVAEADRLYHYSRIMLIVLGLFAATFILATGYFVYRKAEIQTRKIQRLARYDDLTGLLNRREFEARLDELAQDARTTSRQHAILFIDLDRFKSVNDSCGHLAGDELLKQVSRVFRTRIRGSDILARLGGDEFGILLSNCEINKAAEIADEIRSLVENFRFIWQKQIFAITASIGIAAITGQTTDLYELLNNADSACYDSKRQGKNTVQINYC